MAEQVDIAGMKEITLPSAPVSNPEPLTGKEKAGISLTWGIIGVLSIFLIIILSIFVWGESRFLTGLDQLDALKESSPEKLKNLSELMITLETKQASFRAFWLDMLQLVLLNVLFPTLTALLGYVFGTSRNSNTAESDQT